MAVMKILSQSAGLQDLGDENAVITNIIWKKKKKVSYADDLLYQARLINCAFLLC